MFTVSALLELGYFALHFYHILGCWSYQLCILFAHRFLYRFFSPGPKAFLDHEYKITTRGSATLTILTCIQVPFSLLSRPDGFFFARLSRSKHSDLGDTPTKLSRLRTARADKPFPAFLRIIYLVHRLPTSGHLNIILGNEIQNFWDRGITGVSKPDHFLFGGKWLIKDLPDPRESLGNDPLLCAIAASTAEQMAEAFNWRIGLGIRRDLRMLRVRKPYWDKNLALCMKESAPEWCKYVGPAPMQTIVDREGGEDTARDMLESKAIDLSPSFKARNLLASSQFLYFA